MKANRLEHFDFARFLAITGVIACHAYGMGYENPGTNFYSLGRFGVQLFFLISGATVFLSFKKIIKKYKNPYQIFYTRRLFRILPLFVFIGLLEFFMKGGSFLSFFSPFSGLLPDTQNSIPGGWSIWNELYFYLFFPFYYSLRKNSKFVTLIAIFFAVLSIFINFRLFPFGEFQAANWNDYDYLNFFTQFICFATGVEIIGNRYKNISIFCLVYFIFGIIFKILFFNENLLVADRGPLYFLPFISIIMFALIKLLEKINFSVLKNLRFFPLSLFLNFGKITYTSYFLHFYIIYLLNFVFTLTIKPMWFSSNFAILITIILTYFGSIILTPFTEVIWVKIGRKFSKNVLQQV